MRAQRGRGGGEEERIDMNNFTLVKQDPL